jgi:hypothetical protein
MNMPTRNTIGKHISSAIVSPAPNRLRNRPHVLRSFHAPAAAVVVHKISLKKVGYRC